MDLSILNKYFPELSSLQLSQFMSFATLFEEWNEKVNLVSRKDMDHLFERHIVHSLAIAKVMPFSDGSKVLDIGTGGGFPGIPLAILFPKVEFTLVDSIGKKIKVVNDIALQLDLKNVKGINERAENIKGSFDFIVSRAVSRLINFLPWTKGKISKVQKNMLKNGILYLKGGDLKDEIKEIKMKTKVFDISEIYDEEFFETKKVVYIPLS
jgi:16S rRNA (guanine527-N7)-methyltransferase